MKKIKFKQLNIGDRDRIEVMLNNGIKQKEIAEVLERDKSTISREIKRGSKKMPDGKKVYKSSYAQKKARDRERSAKYQWNKINENEELKEYVIRELNDHQSPCAISGRMATDKMPFYASKNCIYAWINTPQGNPCQKHLYSARNYKVGRKKNKKKATPKREMIPNRVSIHERPDISGEFGHWEADTIVSGKKTGSKEALFVCVERKTLKFALKKIPNLKPENFVNEVIKVKEKYEMKSLTLDNGIENRYYERAKLKSYFCDPYSSWQKGKVENINKMIRRYIPKGSDISKYSDEEIQRIEDLINNKYRKSLGYKTSNEAMEEELEKIKKNQQKMSINLLKNTNRKVAFEG